MSPGSVLLENKKRTKTCTLTPAREPGRGEGGGPGDGGREGGGPTTGQMALTLPGPGTHSILGRGGSLGQRKSGSHPSARAWREPEEQALLALLSGAPALSRGTKERGGREPGLPLRPRG